MIWLALLVQVAAPNPAPPTPTIVPVPAPAPVKPVETDPKRLGERVAASGAFGQLARFAIEKDIRELMDANRGLPVADQAALGQIATEKAAEVQRRLIASTGAAYAAGLSVADMQAIVAFNESPAGTRWRETEPKAVAALQQALAGYDFKAEVLKLMCFRTRKACPPKGGGK